MSQETSKCRARRTTLGHFKDFLKGDGIDIGSGDDPLIVESGNVREWDKPDGDAQLLESVPDASLDFVYSSHCLEHMRSVDESLKNWTRVVKTGGFVYVVVPDYTLYEFHRWPSIHNQDHKQSFSMWLPRQRVGRSNHHHFGNDILPLLQSLNLQVVYSALEDDNYNYNIGPRDQTMMGAMAQICFVGRRVAST